jgi:hypothetical protein
MEKILRELTPEQEKEVKYIIERHKGSLGNVKLSTGEIVPYDVVKAVVEGKKITQPIYLSGAPPPKVDIKPEQARPIEEKKETQVELPEKKILYYPLTGTYEKIPYEPKDTTTAQDVIKAIENAQLIAEVSQSKSINTSLTEIFGKPVGKIEKVEVPVEPQTKQTMEKIVNISNLPTTATITEPKLKAEVTPEEARIIISAAAGAALGPISVAFPEVGAALTAVGTYQIVKTIGEAIKEKSLEPLKQFIEPESLAFMGGAIVSGAITQALKPPEVEVLTLPKGKEAIQPLLGYEKAKYGVEYLKKTETGIEEKIFVGSYSTWVKGKPAIVSEKLTQVIEQGEPKIKSIEIETKQITVGPEFYLKRAIHREYYYDPIQAVEQGLSQAEKIQPLGYEIIKPEPIITKESAKPLIFFPIIPKGKEEKEFVLSNVKTETGLKKEVQAIPRYTPEIEKMKPIIEPGIKVDIGKEIGISRKIDIKQNEKLKQVQQQTQTQQTTKVEKTKVEIKTPVIKPPVFIFREKAPKAKMEIERQFRKPSLKLIEKYKPSFYSLERGLKLGKEMKKIEKEIKKAIWRPKL